MANEKWNCNQICRWNDPSDGCIKPTYATCPMANTEPDASGWGQVNEKRLIDANALAKHIKDLSTWWADDGGVYPGGSMKYPDGMYYPEDIISSIDNAPSVDAVEVVHGRWIYEEKPDDNNNVQAHCSVCLAGDLHATALMNKVPYCWKCGAKMDGGNEDV